MLLVRDATHEDIEAMIALESALFVEDAGQHDRYVDPTWPEREGRADFEHFIETAECLLLVATRGDVAVGFLAGYVSPASPTRQPVIFAVLRSLYVRTDQRRSGAASTLTQRFVEWATARDAVEVHVDSYAANDAAQQLYERLDFAVRSTTRVLPISR